MLDCSEPDVKDKCEDNLFYRDCNQLSDANFENYCCTDGESETFEYFDCPNRMDKARVLFQNPPVPTKKTREATNFNRYLDFDQDFIYCGLRNISYSEFRAVKDKHPLELCSLNDGGAIYLSTLWVYLKKDFSFKMSQRLDEF